MGKDLGSNHWHPNNVPLSKVKESMNQKKKRSHTWWRKSECPAQQDELWQVLMRHGECQRFRKHWNIYRHWKARDTQHNEVTSNRTFAWIWVHLFMPQLLCLLTKWNYWLGKQGPLQHEWQQGRGSVSSAQHLLRSAARPALTSAH